MVRMGYFYKGRLGAVDSPIRTLEMDGRDRLLRVGRALHGDLAGVGVGLEGNCTSFLFFIFLLDEKLLFFFFVFCKYNILDK